MFLDKVGLAISWGCIVHCIAIPLIVPFIPVLSAVEGENTHKILLVILLFIALFAFYRGYRLHKQKIILFLGTTGIALLTAALFIEGEHAHSNLEPHHSELLELSWHTIVTTIGSILLIIAHIKNIRFCKCFSEENQGSCSCDSNS